MSANGTNRANGNHNHNHADWTTNPRWTGISRPYSYSDVLRLRGFHPDRVHACATWAPRDFGI